MFVGAQILQYQGYVDINFLAIQQEVIKTLDADGDGKFGASDLKIYWRQLRDILQTGMPSAGSFAGGFSLALYYA